MRTFGTATHLLVLDFETTGLDVVDGPDTVVEVGAILVEVDTLTEVARYTRVMPTDAAGLARIRNNPYVKPMHEANGLLEQLDARVADTDQTAAEYAQTETDLLDICAEFGIAPRQVALAGSGNATFDVPIIRKHMPNLARHATYYPMDIGIMRRFAVMHGLEIPSFNDAKTHRSIDDAECHLAEIAWFSQTFASLS